MISIPSLTTMLLTDNKEYIESDHMCKTTHATYCIADFGGNVLRRGDYNCGVENKISISDLPAGMYTLCIIDGDSLVKNRFHKD